MNNTIKLENLQLSFDTNDRYLLIPSFLERFINTSTSESIRVKDGKKVFCFDGILEETATERICPECGGKMHIHSNKTTILRHLPFGMTLTTVMSKQNRYICEHCRHSEMQKIPFKAEGHRITNELHTYVTSLLSKGCFTLKEISEITGLDDDTVKKIDLDRLKELYTEDDGKKLKVPKQAKYLAIDEFKLHDGHKYATHIVNLETGEVLFIAYGKKKQVVYDFIDLVGEDWMKGVEAVGCDMNSDFEEAFKERFPHIAIVFDYFHIVKNFNEKVVSEVRKEEEKRLKKEGDIEAAQALKGSRFILTSNRETLQKKDAEALEGKVIRKGSELFKEPEVTRKHGYENRLEDLINNNILLFTVELVKEMLKKAYTLDDTDEMKKEIMDIIEVCRETNDAHFLWFARLLENHIEGIVSHASFKLSSGKIEGINNKIKTLRRQGYGYPDDEYFFLKVIDITHK